MRNNHAKDNYKKSISFSITNILLIKVSFSSTWTENSQNPNILVTTTTIPKLSICTDLNLPPYPDQINPSLEITFPKSQSKFFSFIPVKNSDSYFLEKYGNSFYNQSDFTSYYKIGENKNYLKIGKEENMIRICRDIAQNEESELIEVHYFKKNIEEFCLNSCSNEGVCKKVDKVYQCICLESRFGEYCQFNIKENYEVGFENFNDEYKFFSRELESSEIYLSFNCEKFEVKEMREKVKLDIYFTFDQKSAQKLAFLDINSPDPDEIATYESQMVTLSKNEKHQTDTNKMYIGVKSVNNLTLNCKMSLYKDKPQSGSQKEESSNETIGIIVIVVIIVIIIFASLYIIVNEDSDKKKKNNRVEPAGVNESNININQDEQSKDEEVGENDNTQIPNSNIQNQRDNFEVILSDSRSQNSIIEERVKHKEDEGFPSINKGILDLYFPIVNEIFLSDKDKERSPNCAICFDELFKKKLEKGEEKQLVRRIIICGHLFHDKCMQTWFKEEEVCPLCKKYLDYFAIRKHEVENHLKCKELRNKCHSVTYIKDDDNRTVRINDSESNEDFDDKQSEFQTLKFDSYANLDSMKMNESPAEKKVKKRKGSECNPKSCVNGEEIEEESSNFKEGNNKAYSEIGDSESKTRKRNSPPNWENRARRRVSDVSIIDMRGVPENSPEWRLEEDSPEMPRSDESLGGDSQSPKRKSRLKKVTGEVNLTDIMIDQNGNKIEKKGSFNNKSWARTDSLDYYKKEKEDSPPFKTRNRHISEGGGLFGNRAKLAMEIIKEEERLEGLSEDSFI